MRQRRHTGLFAGLVGIFALALLQPVGANAQDDTGDQSDAPPSLAPTSIDALGSQAQTVLSRLP
jgi:hypothetical protein